MNYNANDIEVFLQQKDFIDTAIVPLLPIDFSTTDGNQSGPAAEYIENLVSFIEKQFKGRIFLTPTFSYFQKKGNIDLESILINLKDSGFKYILFITTDQNYAKLSEDFDILWLPAIPLESMDAAVKIRILQEQLNLVIPKLTTLWTGQA